MMTVNGESIILIDGITNPINTLILLLASRFGK